MKEKEICTCFSAAPRTAQVMTIEADKCLVKMEKNAKFMGGRHRQKRCFQRRQRVLPESSRCLDQQPVSQDLERKGLLEILPSSLNRALQTSRRADSGKKKQRKEKKNTRTKEGQKGR